MNHLISVILTTYNRPDALSACLESFMDQTDHDIEILIGDDGSHEETSHRITHYQQRTPVPIRHVYQPNEGFRAATIRNKAVAASSGEYLVFVDGDCIALPSFIARHRALARQGFWVAGNRCLLSRNFTQSLLTDYSSLHRRSFPYFLHLRLQGHINRVAPLLHNPLPLWRYWRPKRWQNAKTCNLAVWRQDFLAVNGFDEQFQGWGYEDSDLVIRLLNRGIKRKEGCFSVPVLHLWHPENDRSGHDENYARLMSRLADPRCQRVEKGLDQYLR